jgi:low temperature requirement protein LtrA
VVGDGSGTLAGRGLEPATPGTRVTWLELFYDLVYVFAFVNVGLTASASRNTETLLRGLLILALLWFAWTTFAALGNAVRADQGIMPLVGLANMAIIFVAAQTIPYAFAGREHGHAADFVFAGCYLAARGLQVLAIWYAARSDPRLHPRWLALALPPLISTALLLAAAFAPHVVHARNPALAVQVALWVLAIAVAYGVAAVTGGRGLPIVSARHWTDRYAQVVLIALGESFISLGISSGLLAGLPLTWPVVIGSALGVVVIATAAWAYFDMRFFVGAHALHRATERAQTALARDAYTFLHLPMIIGIILFSLGQKEVLGAIANPRNPISHPAPDTAIYLFIGGLFVYLMALLGFQLRTEHWASRFQIVARATLLGLIPVALFLPGLAALGLLAAWLVSSATINHVRLAEKRSQLRRSALEEERALEATETWWRYGEEEPPSRHELQKWAKSRIGRPTKPPA